MEVYDFSEVLKQDTTEKTPTGMEVPVILWLISDIPQFQFQENWLRVVYQNLEMSKLPDYLFSKEKETKTESDLDRSITPRYNDFPRMKKGWKLERLLKLLHDLDDNNDQMDKMLKLIKAKSSNDNKEDIAPVSLENSLINLITQKYKPFKDQLLYVRSVVSNDNSSEVASLGKTTAPRNFRSMPMKYDTFHSLNLNLPLIPDNHNHIELLEFSTSIIIDIFYGIMLEERILIVSENLDKLAAI